MGEKQKPNPKTEFFILKNNLIICLYCTQIHYLYGLLKVFLYIILKNCP